MQDGYGTAAVTPSGDPSNSDIIVHAPHRRGESFIDDALAFTGGFLKGAVGEAWDMAKGVFKLGWNLSPAGQLVAGAQYLGILDKKDIPSWAPNADNIYSPVGKGIEAIASGKVTFSTVRAQIDRYVDDWEDTIKQGGPEMWGRIGNFAGHGTVFVGSFFVGAGEANAAVKGGEAAANVGKLGEAADALNTVDRIAETAELTTKAGANGVKSADQLLSHYGVTNSGLRQAILKTGFDPAILADASPATLTRFNKLFQGSMDAGKAFKGRMGNLATRARTIETAVDIDRSGLTPEFERAVRLRNGQARYVDVVALDAARQPVQFYQLYKAVPITASTPLGIPIREINAANDILKATGIRPTMIRTGP